MMKKFSKINKNIFWGLLSIMVLGLTSCAYDDFVPKEYDYTSVYLPKPTISRTFIEGKGMRIGVGIVLGGRLHNKQNVDVGFSLNNSAVTDAGFEVLPDDLYTLVDANGQPTNKITIPAGKVQGFVYVKADSIKYLSDPKALGNNYALGFQLETVKGADSILQGLKQTVISFSYINKLYGYYVQKGTYESTDANGTMETHTYKALITDPVELTMEGPHAVIMNALANFRSAPQGNPQPKAKISIAADNSISISSIPGEIPVTGNGDSRYNPDEKEVYVNYSFDYEGTSYKANDTLRLRNKVVDGVNIPNYNFNE